MNCFKKSFLFLSTMIGLISFTPALQANDDPFASYEKAAFYHDHAHQQWKVAHQILKKYSFPSKGNVLDINCRGGRTTAYIATRIPDATVVGTDESANMIEFAKKTYPTAFYPNIHFQTMDLMAEVPKPIYDFITFFSALHWYNDQAIVLTHLYDWLNMGGKMLVTVPGKPAPEIELLLEEVRQDERWQSHFVDFVSPRIHLAADEYESYLESIGFSHISVKEHQFHYKFEGKSDFANWFRAVGSFMIDRLPADQQEAFVSTFVNRWVERFHPRDDGRILFSHTEIVIHAEK